MHNTDRTQQYMEAGFPQAEMPMSAGMAGEYGAGMAGEFGQGLPGELAGEAGWTGELVNPVTGEINPEMELALAAELLSVGNEMELNQFIGGLIRHVGRGFRNFANSGLGRTLGGLVRNVARAALPTLGGALGSLIPIPGVGTALGAAAGQAAGRALGLEGEAMSHEDRQFEIARRVVQIGVEGARTLDAMPQSEFMTEQEIASVLGSIASRVLPALGSAVLGGLSGQAASGGQASGGLSGGLQVSSPGGWNVRLGGQAGGQLGGGSAVGVNLPAPPVPFQPGGSGRPAVTPPRPGMAAPGGRWIRRGRHLIVLNAY